jgi:phenylpropionate dioxygenase-like ring-hydroxylating dioxygenase large terminal subunit
MTNPMLTCESSSAQVPCFAVQETDGLIWVALEPSNDHQPYRSRWSTDSTLESVVWRDEVKADWLDAIENLLDATHTPLVHRGLVRSLENKQRIRALIRVDSRMIEVEYQGEGKQQGWISKLLERDRTTSFGRFHLPCVAELEYRSSRGPEFCLNSYFTPMDSEKILVHTELYWRRGKIPGWFKRGLLTPLFRRVFHQDARILRMQLQSAKLHPAERYLHWEGDFVRGWIETWLRSGALPTISDRIIELEI